MANVAWISGHIMCLNGDDRSTAIEKIDSLPKEPYQDCFSIWNGIFHAPLAPCRAGFIITFGLSHKYLGEDDVIGEFLNFWEDFIEDLPVHELFIALEQEFICSHEPFGKFYFQWQREYFPKSDRSRWVFKGTMPINSEWQSRFETDLNDEDRQTSN